MIRWLSTQQKGCHTAFCTNIINKGTFKWTLKLISKGTVGNSMSIGIIDSSKTNKPFTSFIGGRDDIISYGYYSCNGASCSVTKYGYPPYGVSYGTVGDVVTTILDMDNLTLAYEVNGKYQGIAFENIKKISYTLAISTYNVDDAWKYIWKMN